jgi:hypothetical protein
LPRPHGESRGILFPTLETVQYYTYCNFLLAQTVYNRPFAKLCQSTLAMIETENRYRGSILADYFHFLQLIMYARALSVCCCAKKMCGSGSGQTRTFRAESDPGSEAWQQKIIFFVFKSKVERSFLCQHIKLKKVGTKLI